MADIVSKAKRSQMMSGIKGKNTKPEIQIRKALFARGFRYGLHNKQLPGKPDLAFPKYNSVIFVNGCYWHGHENCHLFRPPKSNTTFWNEKIASNKARDKKKHNALLKSGWRVLVIWECALKGKKGDLNKVTDIAEKWLKEKGSDFLFIRYQESNGIVASSGST